MAVRAEFRRQGIGRAMLAAVDAHAGGTHGVSQVCLHVEPENRGALRAYAAAAFREPGPDDTAAAYLDRRAAIRDARARGAPAPRSRSDCGGGDGMGAAPTAPVSAVSARVC